MASGTRTYIIILVLGTIITGAANSLFSKYQDNQCVSNCNNPDVSTHKKFEQPALQTLQMFLGEMTCFVVYYLLYKTTIFNFNDGYRPIDGEGAEPLSINFKQSLRLTFPAICDLCGTTLLYFALMYIPVSIYQMVRGSVVLFVAFLSVVFLKTPITKLQWISLLLIFTGISIVGLSGTQDSTSSDDDESSLQVFLGVFLVFIAEFCHGCQYVVEEHILAKQPIIPLQLVYYEGTYGAVITFALMIVLNVAVGVSESPSDFVHSPFNMKQGFIDFFSNEQVILAAVFIMVSIAAFNFFGISLTYSLSATSRTTIDNCRTLVVWFISMGLGWEQFRFLQVIGFGLLVFGTLCFNGALDPEKWDFVPLFLKSQ